ncbi:MAG: hypothetical protein ACLPT4_00995 [Verrucomicrobiia bacterium]
MKKLLSTTLIAAIAGLAAYAPRVRAQAIFVPGYDVPSTIATNAFTINGTNGTLVTPLVITSSTNGATVTVVTNTANSNRVFLNVIQQGTNPCDVVYDQAATANSIGDYLGGAVGATWTTKRPALYKGPVTLILHSHATNQTTTVWTIEGSTGGL